MAEWCYQVVDFCKFKRETVAISMSYLDRYLMTENGRPVLLNRKLFQLAAMTCLYTAIKIHEPEAMEPKVIAGLSRGTYTVEQVCEMEMSILTNIQWRMNPPTALAFVHHFLSMIPAVAMKESDRQAALELIKFQTELAVNEYCFVGVNASTIAYASVANALPLETEFLSMIAKLTNIDESSEVVSHVQSRLIQTCSSGRPNSSYLSTSSASMYKSVESSKGSVHESPRAVTSAQ
jgi:hypothetical protein